MTRRLSSWWTPCSAWTKAALAAASLGAVLGAAGVARADATGWASVNGGAALVAGTTATDTTVETDDRVRSQLQFDVGVGSTPAAPIIVGGLFRIAPTLGEHTDFSVVARGATSGFQTGPIGVALDVGGYARADDEASVGVVGGLVLGGPLGLQLSVMGHLGTTDDMGATALLGIDLLRLTLYRESLLEYWRNPLPPEKDVAAR